MSTYIKGASGDCVDCGANDPCGAGDCVNLRTTPDHISIECRVRDVEYVGNQLHVVNPGFYRVVQWDGTSYSVGPQYTQTHTTLKMCRTSHSGNTFAALDTSGNVYLYSIDTTTLVMTNTAGPIATGAAGTVYDMCFLDDDIILVASINNGSPNDDFNFYKGSITGGGTGITFASAITKSHPDGAYTEFVKVEKVEDGKAVAIITTSESPSVLHATFIDATGTPAFGSTTNLGSYAGTNTIYWTDESDDGAIVSYARGGIKMRYFKYNTVGTEFTPGTYDFWPALTSSTSGVVIGTTSQVLTPITVSGTTITLGTPVSDTEIGSNDRIRGSDASTALHYKHVDGVKKGCKVT